MKRKTKLLIRDAFLSTILSCIFLAILSITFVNIRFFNPLHKALKDFSFLDVYYSQKFEDNSKVNKDIVLVNIENHNREGIAIMLEAVLKEDPKVVPSPLSGELSGRRRRPILVVLPAPVPHGR